MTKSAFTQLFLKALEDAAIQAEEAFDKTIPRTFEILVHSHGVMSIDDALDYLWVDETHFYIVTTMFIAKMSQDVATAWVHHSGHAPGTWEQTWNEPPGMGPFHVVLPSKL